MGFLLEEIKPCRHAGPNDLEACREVLGKLHRLGIKHGETNLHNFLIRNGTAVLIDLECAERCGDAKTLEQEMSELAGQLADKSGRGGTGPSAVGQLR
jgi:tRNA A-37 threonylcarbamoyl transferase component Bud32